MELLKSFATQHQKLRAHQTVAQQDQAALALDLPLRAQVQDLPLHVPGRQAKLDTIKTAQDRSLRKEAISVK